MREKSKKPGDGDLPENFAERENRPIPAALLPDANTESPLCDWSRALTLCNAALVGDDYMVRVLLPMLHDCDQDWCQFLAKIDFIEDLLDQVDSLILSSKSAVLSAVLSKDDVFLDTAINCCDLALDSALAVDVLLDMQLSGEEASREVMIQTSIVPICGPSGEQKKQEAERLVYGLYVFQDTLFGIMDVLFAFRAMLTDGECKFELDPFPCHSLRLLSNVAQGIALRSTETMGLWLRSRGSQKSQRRTKPVQRAIDALEAAADDDMRFYSPSEPDKNDQDWLEDRIGVYCEVVFALEHLQSIGKIPSRVEDHVVVLLEATQAWIAEAEIYKSELAEENQ